MGSWDSGRLRPCRVARSGRSTMTALGASPDGQPRRVRVLEGAADLAAASAGGAETLIPRAAVEARCSVGAADSEFTHVMARLKTAGLDNGHADRRGHREQPREYTRDVNGSRANSNAGSPDSCQPIVLRKPDSMSARVLAD